MLVNVHIYIVKQHNGIVEGHSFEQPSAVIEENLIYGKSKEKHKCQISFYLEALYLPLHAYCSV